MLESLNHLDTELFIRINQLHGPFFDRLMVYFSATIFWLPLFLVMLYLIIREYKWKTLLALGFIALTVLLADQLSVHAFKNVFERLRPCHHPDLIDIVHLVNGCGGAYGFVSSHAANTFAIATLLTVLLVRKYKWSGWLLYAWAIVVAYSRIYLGKHYPGDVLFGALLGILIGCITYWLYQIAEKKLYR